MNFEGISFLSMLRNTISYSHNQSTISAIDQELHTAIWPMQQFYVEPWQGVGEVLKAGMHSQMSDVI